MNLDLTDKKILNLIQSDFPVEPEPFRLIGEAVGISEDEAIARVKTLIDCGLIRRLGGIFDSRSLGYQGALCAMQVPEKDIDRVARVVNSFPGVTHNYLREDSFNMWFTVLSESNFELEGILNEIKNSTGINKILVFPGDKMYKIRVSFDLA